MNELPEYERDYQTRRWQVYQLPINSGDQPALAPDTTLVWCAADSVKARVIGDSPQRFYYDYELIAAGLDPATGSRAPQRLQQTWTAPDGTVFPAGTLVLKTYHGVNDEAPASEWHWTYLLELV